MGKNSTEVPATATTTAVNSRVDTSYLSVPSPAAHITTSPLTRNSGYKAWHVRVSTGKTSVLSKTSDKGPSSLVLPIPMAVNVVPLNGVVGSELMERVSLGTWTSGGAYPKRDT